jgi:hypothetical protein
MDKEVGIVEVGAGQLWIWRHGLLEIGGLIKDHWILICGLLVW